MRITDFRGRTTTPGAQATAQQAQRFINQAFPVDRANTRFVSLARVKNVRRGWSSVTVTKVPGESSRRHAQLIYPPSGYQGTFKSCRGIRLDCDCQRHVFVWNYALWEAGLATQDRTNREPPDVTNPGLELGCCKHLVVVLRYLIRDNPRFPHAAEDAGVTTNRTIALTTMRQANRNRR